VILALGLSACGARVADPDPSGGQAAQAPASPALLVDITDEVGLGATREPWRDGTYQLPEIQQGGLALFDVDGDGDLDLFHVRVPPPGELEGRARQRLYLLGDDGRFADATVGAGLDTPGFGQGVAVGDVDNDGDMDVYVTNYGADTLYLNHGDGTFTDVTSRAGFSGDLWSTSATFCDYDQDGFLDLYVVHYVAYDPDTDCLNAAEQREYCGPQAFRGEPDKLYRNKGDGTFSEVTHEAGIRLPAGGERARGLGVVCADLTRDGLADFFVANDAEANQLWVNRGDGTFVDEAIARGVAVNGYGKPEASMGIAVGDTNGDEVDDLFVTTLNGENNQLFVGSPGLLFFERAREARLSDYDSGFTGFGCGLFDLEHDGDLDIAVANGAVRRRAKLDAKDVPEFWREYAEPNRIFVNDGAGHFTDPIAEAGAFASTTEVSRSLVLGDLDRDGDLDLVVSNVDNSVRAYRNDAPAGGSHWLQVRAVTGERDALGALVTVRAGGTGHRRHLLAGNSYLTGSPPVAHFGLGGSETVEEILVVWPDGRRERFAGVPADQALTLRQGTGEAS
jgi:hypothetical protein